jgi:hypothetical protein
MSSIMVTPPLVAPLSRAAGAGNRTAVSVLMLECRYSILRELINLACGRDARRFSRTGHFGTGLRNSHLGARVHSWELTGRAKPLFTALLFLAAPNFTRRLRILRRCPYNADC